MASNPEPTPRNPSAADLLALAVASGESLRSASKKLDIGYRTARRWSRAPRFRARVEQYRSEMIGQALGKLAARAGGAVDTLAELMEQADTDATRLAAAKAILDKLPGLSEHFGLSERVRVLESQAEAERIGEGNPWQRN